MDYRKLLAFILLGASLSAHAASFADLKNWKSASLLNDRLRAVKPQSAAICRD